MSDTCNCCSGTSAETPLLVFNRPGLNAIAYRAGVHDDFKKSLLAALSASAQPALRDLTSRNDNDFTIALLDSWSVVSDVLTFYQERIANESYLRTATERLSILELARLIDYKLRPGVAAGTYLSFKLDDLPGALTAGVITGQGGLNLPPVLISTGTKVQSIPGPNETPQTFETIEQIYARAEWNALKPKLTQPQAPDKNAKRIVFKGLSNDLKVGDVLYINSPQNFGLRRILNINLDINSQTTWADLDNQPAMPVYVQPNPVANGSINDFPDKVSLDDGIVQSIVGKIWEKEDLTALIKTQSWQTADFLLAINQVKKQPAASNDNGVYVFRKRVPVFGYNAVKQASYDEETTRRKFLSSRTTVPATPNWVEWPLDAESQKNIFLDNSYDGVLPKSFVAVQDPNQAIEDLQAIHVGKVIQRSRTAYGLSAKTTLLQFDSDINWYDPNATDISALRNLAVYVQSEKLELVESPIDEAVTGDRLELQTLDLNLSKGQVVLLTGTRSDLPGAVNTEPLTIADIIIENGLTFLVFEKAIKYKYVRSTVFINANVAKATNGESVSEVLGSGDTSKAFQKFSLKQTPLTYITSGSADGVKSTLEIRVNDILWDETDSFIEHKANDRVYVTQLNDDATTTVIFGNGINGSRVPRGQNNIKANYRRGIGLGGLVKANQLSQLITRPLGVKEVTNMMAPTGAADAEKIEDARANATLTIRSLGRLVSLKDYEDFARAFPGIDKALATWTWFGQKRGICVTVAGSNGTIVDEDNQVYDPLTSALRNSGDPNVPAFIISYKPVFFRLEAKVQIDPAYIVQNVLNAVDAALRDRFSFKNRQLGQLVSQSEAITTIQQVDGVVAVDLDKLYRSDDNSANKLDLNNLLRSDKPVPGSEKIVAAELLTIDFRPIQLTQML
jgi:predicted phage baseplate assembly protein